MKAEVFDISDRVYQGRLYALLDQARFSIVISMYLLLPGKDERHPVNRLLEDLLEARRRGVEVTVYLNTKFKNYNPAKLEEDPWLIRLKKAGVKLRLVSPVRRMHDKLVIIDRRYVVEGSMNWSVSAIADNLESATLIDSPELAEAKLKRFSFFPIWGEEAKKIPAKRRRAAPQRQELFPAGPPTFIEVPTVFIEQPQYFPRMLTNNRERSMKLFLLLIYLGKARGVNRFILAPEAAGEFLEILPGQDRIAVRRQVIRVLKSLEKEEGLIQVRFRHGNETRVELLLPQGPTFLVSSEDLTPGQLADLTDNQILVRLIEAKLREENLRLEDLTAPEIQRRFHLQDGPLKRGTTKRRPQHLVFP